MLIKDPKFFGGKIIYVSDEDDLIVYPSLDNDEDFGRWRSKCEVQLYEKSRTNVNGGNGITGQV